jgi:hypothetical protein
METYKIAAIPGDGIGQEVIAAGLELLNAHGIAANEKVIKEVQTRSGGQCASSTMIQRTEDIAPWFERGCRLFTFAGAAILLMDAARGAVDAFRSAVPAK